MFKTCKECGEHLPSFMFTRRASAKDGLHHKCKTCKNRGGNVWRKNNPERSRCYEYRKKYGITLEQYEKMLEEQDHSCYICKSKDGRSHGNRLVVDHCHSTGRVRALLCSPCNKALGLAQENEEILMSMINYIRRV